MPLCPTKGGLSVRFATLDQNFFEDVNTQSSYLQEGAVHNGGHREGRQGAGAFFSVIARPEVLARECHHQVNPASEKVVCERVSSLRHSLTIALRASSFFITTWPLSRADSRSSLAGCATNRPR